MIHLFLSRRTLGRVVVFFPMLSHVYFVLLFNLILRWPMCGLRKQRLGVCVLDIIWMIWRLLNGFRFPIFYLLLDYVLYLMLGPGCWSHLLLFLLNLLWMIWWVWLSLGIYILLSGRIVILKKVKKSFYGSLVLVLLILLICWSITSSDIVYVSFSPLVYHVPLLLWVPISFLLLLVFGGTSWKLLVGL